MLSTEIAACRSVSLCWAPVAPRRARFQGFVPADPPKPHILPSSPTFHELQAPMGAVRAGGNLRAARAKPKDRRRASLTLLQDAASIMDQFCSFKTALFCWTACCRLCWGSSARAFFHHLTSALKLAFCSALQRAGDREGKEVKAAERGVGSPRGGCAQPVGAGGSHPTTTPHWSQFPAPVAEGQTRKQSWGSQDQSENQTTYHLSLSLINL